MESNPTTGRHIAGGRHVAVNDGNHIIPVTRGRHAAGPTLVVPEPPTTTPTVGIPVVAPEDPANTAPLAIGPTRPATTRRDRRAAAALIAAGAVVLIGASAAVSNPPTPRASTTTGPNPSTPRGPVTAPDIPAEALDIVPIPAPTPKPKPVTDKPIPRVKVPVIAEQASNVEPTEPAVAPVTAPIPVPPPVPAPEPVEPQAPPPPPVPEVEPPAPTPVPVPPPVPSPVPAPAPVPTPPATTPVFNESRGAAVANAARAQVGVTQDCTMLVTNALRAVGINFHGWPAEYYSLGYAVQPGDEQVGDLIFYQNGGTGVPHIAVYIGGGKAVHGGWMGNQTVIESAFVGSGPSFIRLR